MYHKFNTKRYPVEANLNWYGGMVVNLTPREQIQTCVVIGVVFLLIGILATVAALISTPDISQPLRMIGPSFLVIGVLVIAICRCCLKKMDAKDGDEDDVSMLLVESENPASNPEQQAAQENVVMLSVESQQPASYPVKEHTEPQPPAYSSITFFMK